MNLDIFIEHKDWKVVAKFASQNGKYRGQPPGTIERLLKTFYKGLPPEHQDIVALVPIVLSFLGLGK